MVTTTSHTQGTLTKFETLVAEYKLTLACCREAASRLEAVERELRHAAGALGIARNDLDLPHEIVAQPQAAVPKAGTTVNLVQLFSDRELLVFSLMGHGLTLHQISERLCIASSTVESYKDRLKRKLGLPSGAALVREAVLWVGRR